MTSKDLIDACDILLKLEQEFSMEESKLSVISDEHAVKIDELDQQITTFRKNEDVDFRVFSPRNVSTGTSDKIKALESEKKQLEREKKEADKQLRYYSGKTEMISRVLRLLRGDLIDGSEDDSLTVKRSRDPFGFIDGNIDDEEDILTDRSEGDVSALFAVKNDNKEDEAPVEETETKKKDVSIVSSNGVPVEEVERVCHKVEFCEKIISNDGVRAKLEIKNIVADLKDLIRGYS